MISRGAGFLALGLAFVFLRGNGRWTVVLGLAGAFALMEFAEPLHARLPLSPRAAKALSPRLFRWVGGALAGLTIVKLLVGILTQSLFLAGIPGD